MPAWLPGWMDGWVDAWVGGCADMWLLFFPGSADGEGRVKNQLREKWWEQTRVRPTFGTHDGVSR